MLSSSIVRAISFSSMHGPDAFSHLLMNTMNHIHVHIYTVIVSPLLNSAMKKTPGSGNGGRHLHGSTLGHCPPRRRDMTQHGEQRASHRGLFVCRITMHYQQLLEPKHCWRILGGHQKRICLKICVEEYFEKKIWVR